MFEYNEKPLTLLLECYVLDVIGELDSKRRLTLAKMEPNLVKTYHVSGNWKFIIKKVMSFPEDIDQQICKFWKGYSTAAKNQNLPNDPNVFARQFIKQNFLET